MNIHIESMASHQAAEDGDRIKLDGLELDIKET